MFLSIQIFHSIKPKKFGFEKIWSEAPGFKEIVHNCWINCLIEGDTATRMVKKLKFLIKEIKWVISFYSIRTSKSKQLDELPKLNCLEEEGDLCQSEKLQRCQWKKFKSYSFSRRKNVELGC